MYYLIKIYTGRIWFNYGTEPNAEKFYSGYFAMPNIIIYRKNVSHHFASTTSLRASRLIQADMILTYLPDSNLSTVVKFLFPDETAELHANLQNFFQH